jgi:transposase-like protein
VFEEALGAIVEPELKTEETREFIRRVRWVMRRKFTPEERVRIGLEGFRHEASIRDLCWREDIRPTVYYAWLRDFTEAGMTVQTCPCYGD